MAEEVKINFHYGPEIGKLPRRDLTPWKSLPEDIYFNRIAVVFECNKFEKRLLALSNSLKYSIPIQFPFYIFPGMSAEDEWYNKSLSALRSSHHPNLSAAPMLQYQS